MRAMLLAAALCLAGVCLSGTLEAATALDEAGEGAISKLPLPRFVSLGSGEVNVRTGPGPKHPIIWVFQRRGLPVEVVAEYEFYRKIRDSDGAEGWVHKNMLSGKRTAIITGSVRGLLQAPERTAGTVLFAEPGVQGRVLACRDRWCELEVAGRRGFAEKGWLYGVYPTEQIE
jgi:SH3-like domain-containing protein